MDGDDGRWIRDSHAEALQVIEKFDAKRQLVKNGCHWDGVVKIHHL